MSTLANIVTGIMSVVGTLSQNSTNGRSLLGTLQAELFPAFLTNNPLPNGYPWGTDTAYNTNYYANPPDTGVTRSYTFMVNRTTLAPDGFEKDMIVVNGAFPGPTIEANWGDTISVTVTNDITGPEEPLTMHWHGFLQKRTNYMDGVPGYTQCPIPPGQSFTYTFKADLYGTSLYHSHLSAMYTSGTFGPIVVHGPKNADYDIDLGPVLLNDWYHQPYEALVNQTMAPSASPPILSSDSNLINGKMNYPCIEAPAGSKCTNNAGLAKFNFTAGKVHRLRLINAGGEGYQQFSIDGHQLTVIANDFVPVQPYNTTVVTLGIGQRTDVLVKANMSATSAVYMRSNITCVESANPDAVAIIYYNKANTRTTIPANNPQVYTAGCANDPLSETVPSYPIDPPVPESVTTLNITIAPNATGSWVWSMNNHTTRTDYNNPTLLDAAKGNTSFFDPQSIYAVGNNSAAYRFIINNQTPVPHPMHFHGHNMYVLGVGAGNYPGPTGLLSTSNPQRRDTQIVPANGYIVVQADANNPGLWVLHCHIAWHLSAGLAVQVLENLAAVEQLSIPAASQQVCQEWDAYSSQVGGDSAGGGSEYEQVDSGL